MTGKPRKPLSRLVGDGAACQSSYIDPCDGELVTVTGSCPHGHSDMTDDGGPELTLCVSHWHIAYLYIEQAVPLYCPDCDHVCGLDMTARWEDGRSVSVHIIPQPVPEGTDWAGELL